MAGMQDSIVWVLALAHVLQLCGKDNWCSRTTTTSYSVNANFPFYNVRYWSGNLDHAWNIVRLVVESEGVLDYVRTSHICADNVDPPMGFGSRRASQ